MSKISTIYDKIREVIPTLSGFSGKFELSNPYSLADNPETYLRDGWGVVIGEGTQGTLRTVCAEDHETRQFTILLARQLVHIENRVDILAEQSKNILEDIRIVKTDFLNFDQLGIGDDIQKIDFVTASGVEFLTSGDFSILTASITFNVEYTETI